MAKTRKTRLLSEAKRREILALVTAGYSMAGAARYIGCTALTIERELAGSPSFQKKLLQAELAAELEPLRAVRAAASENWRAAVWLLERTRPEQYARRPNKAINANDMAYLAEQFAEALSQEVDDPKVRQRVMERLESIDLHAQHESEATQSLRRAK